MDRFTLGVGLLALVGIGVVAQGGDSPGVDRPLRILPPDESRYEPNLGFYHSWGGGQFLLQNPIHDIYTGGLLPPPLGMTQIHSFQSAAGGTFVYPGGSMPVSIFPAPVSVRVTCSSETPTTGTFQTEMLQLDLTAPCGVMIRESPTKPSTGQTTITDIGGGMYHIDSFFDVWTELSLDGGASWIPSDYATTMCLGPIPAPAGAGVLGIAGLLAMRRRR